MATFKLKVKPFKGTDYFVECAPDTTLLELKRRVVAGAPNLGDVDLARVRLILLGKVLVDDASTAASNNITESSVLHMIVKQPAEAPEPQPARPQPHPEMPRSNSTPFDEAGAIPLPAGAFGGLDMGGLFRGILQQVGTAAAALNAQRPGGAAAAATAAADAPAPAPAAATPRPQTPAAEQQQPASAGPGGLPPGLPPGVFQHVQLGPGFPLGMAPPPHFLQQPSPLAAVHVHLHVTMAELDAVPEQIQRLQQRIAANNPGPTITQIHIQTHNVGVDPAAAAAQAARAPNPATSRPQAAAPPAAPSRRTLMQVAPPAGELVGSSLLTVLKAALQGAGVPEAMQLMSGQWTAADRAREPLRAYTVQRTANQTASAELREELVEEAVHDAMAKIDANADVQRELRTRVREGVDARRLIQGLVRLALRDLLDLALDGRDAAEFAPNVRKIAVRTVGHATSYFERKVARNGPADVDAIVNATINGIMTEALRSRPDIAPFAGMVAPMLGGTLREWRHEYETSRRQAQDDAKLEAAAARVVPVSTRTATVAAAPPPQAAAPAVAAPAAPPAATRAASDDLDDILDAVLDSAGSGASAPAAAPSRLQQALQAEARLPAETRQSLAAMVAEDLRNASNIVRPPDHYFDAYRSAF